MEDKCVECGRDATDLVNGIAPVCEHHAKEASIYGWIVQKEMLMECPNRRPPPIAIDPKTDKIYEGAAICSTIDKFCLLDEGLECDTYNEFLKELGSDEPAPVLSC